MQISVPVSSYALRSLPASCVEVVNCVAEALPPGAKTRLVLSRLPAPKHHATPGTGPIRGMHKFDGDLFTVSGTGLYRVASDGTSTAIGTIPGSGSVCMANNRDALVIVATPDAYWTDGTAVTQITDPDYTARGAKYVRFLDNYMMFQEPNSDRFFWADVASVTSFDALNFATSEANPDRTVGFEVDHRQAVFLGEESGELWENTGQTFERAINGLFEVGCFNGDTICKLDNSIFWAANDYTVRRLEGYTPRRVSTHAIEQFLSTVDVTTLWAHSYSQDGHFYYVLGSSSGCKAYDVTTGEWGDRKTYPYDYSVWRYHAAAHGRQYVGNSYSNAIAYYDPNTYTEDGGIQRMSFTTQPIYAEGRMAFHDRLEIVLEYGTGLTLGQGADPEIMCDYSNDGGITWTALPNRKLGKIGEYRRSIVWNGLGSSKMRVYRFAISDPVKVAVTDILVEVRGGRL